MNDMVQADYEALQTIERRFGLHAEQSTQMLNHISEGMARLRGGWVGVGADAFFAEMEEAILPALRRLAASFEEARRATGTIAQLFQGAEEEGAQPFQPAASGGMGGAGVGMGAVGAGLGGAAAALGGGAAQPTPFVPSSVGGVAGGAWSPEGYRSNGIDDVALGRLLDDNSFLPGDGQGDRLGGGAPSGGASGSGGGSGGGSPVGFDDEMAAWRGEDSTASSAGGTEAGSGGGAAAGSGGGAAPVAPSAGESAPISAVGEGAVPLADDMLGAAPSESSPSLSGGETGGRSTGPSGGGSSGSGGGGIPDLGDLADFQLDEIRPSAETMSVAGGMAAQDAAPPAPMSVGTPLGMGAGPEAPGASAWQGSSAASSATVGATRAAAAPALTPMGIAAMTPFLALLGKAIKERIEDR